MPTTYAGRTLRTSIAYVVFGDIYPEGRGYRFLATADFDIDQGP